MRFTPGIQPPLEQVRPIQWFVFDEAKLLVKTVEGGCALPQGGEIGVNPLEPKRKLFFGVMGKQHCYAARLHGSGPLPAGLAWVDLRALPGVIGEELFWVAGRANHLLDWDQAHQYCGRCGRATLDKSDERAKICPGCGLLNHPRLSPAVIVAVIRGDQILLARNKRFRTPVFSVLAGFVEPGETLEACVRREIREEVGLEVKNIRYFGSQPWPFPNSLMAAFVADYAGGQIAVDNVELLQADWFRPHALPAIPSKISIARQMIDWFAGTPDGALPAVWPGPKGPY